MSDNTRITIMCCLITMLIGFCGGLIFGYDYGYNWGQCDYADGKIKYRYIEENIGDKLRNKIKGYYYV
jgi:hypothetical protein